MPKKHQRKVWVLFFLRACGLHHVIDASKGNSIPPFQQWWTLGGKATFRDGVVGRYVESQEADGLSPIHPFARDALSGEWSAVVNGNRASTTDRIKGNACLASGSVFANSFFSDAKGDMGRYDSPFSKPKQPERASTRSGTNKTDLWGRLCQLFGDDLGNDSVKKGRTVIRFEVREWFRAKVTIERILDRFIVTCPYPYGEGITQSILDTRPQEWFLVLCTDGAITWLPLFAIDDVGRVMEKFYGRFYPVSVCFLTTVYSY